MMRPVYKFVESPIGDRFPEGPGWIRPVETVMVHTRKRCIQAPSQAVPWVPHKN